ncbi:MAG: DUF2959 domain-containing protein [Pseudomonadota bacterium]
MRRIAIVALVTLFLGACSSAYYGALESVGVHKREILVDRIGEAQESQEEAAEQFQTALEQFQSVVSFDGGDLEDLYEDLADEFESSESGAEEVRDRIEAVRDVADALFDEWTDELEQYSDARLRSRSEASLRETRTRYNQLMRAMERAESRLDPVLDAFRDQVLYLKHNLNARAIAALKDEVSSIEGNVGRLIKDMNSAIAEAQDFIAEFESAG